MSDLTLSIRKEAETPHQVTTTTKKVMSTSVKKKVFVKPREVELALTEVSKRYSTGIIFFNGEGEEETDQDTFDTRRYFWNWIVECLKNTRGATIIDIVPMYDVTGLVLGVFDLIPNMKKKLKNMAKEVLDKAMKREVGMSLMDYLVLVRKSLKEAEGYGVKWDVEYEKDRLWGYVVEMELGSLHRDLMKIQRDDNEKVESHRLSVDDLIKEMMPWALEYESMVQKQSEKKKRTLLLK